MRVTYKNPGFEHSVDSIALFLNDTSYWSDSLFFFFPQLEKEKLSGFTLERKKEYIAAQLKSVWHELSDEINKKVETYNNHFNNYHGQIEDALSEAFETDTRKIFNNIVGNICLNPISPRFLEKRCFDVFYKNSEYGALGVSLHEIIHYIWFYVWNRHFGDNYSEYERPSLKWILSEMVVESIMQDERLASINPYYPREHGGCVYSYFYDMIIEGKPILDTLNQMHRKNHMTDYMEIAYEYCVKHEEEIRRHITEAEQKP